VAAAAAPATGPQKTRSVARHLYTYVGLTYPLLSASQGEGGQSGRL
jgi:hypothetical protein